MISISHEGIPPSETPAHKNLTKRTVYGHKAVEI